MKATRAHDSRFMKLRTWMDDPEREITFYAVSAELGIGESTVRKHLQNDTIPTEHYQKLVRLGFPIELLPRPEDKKPGRKKKKVRFPGKLSAAEDAFLAHSAPATCPGPRS